MAESATPPAAKPQRGRLRGQLFATIICDMGAMCMGMSIGWANPIAGILIQETSKSAFKWIASLMFLGAALITFPMFFILDRLGRKRSLYLLPPIYFPAYLSLAFFKNVYVLCVARFFVGFSAAGFAIVAPTFVGEISETYIRGRFASVFQLMLVFGLVVSLFVGILESQLILSLTCLIPMLIFVIIFPFFPETPVYHLLKHRKEKADKALLFYRGKNYDLAKEMSRYEELVANAEARKGKLIQNMKHKSSKKSLFFIVSIMVFLQFNGVTFLSIYSISLFAIADIKYLKPTTCGFIHGIVQFTFALIGSLLVDKFGRKVLLVLSYLGMMIAHILLGTFFFIHENNKELVKDIGIITLVFVCFYLACFALGSGTVSWVLMAELIPLDVKPLVAASGSLANWGCGFIVGWSFLPVINLIGIPALFYIFAIICLLVVFFVILLLPETKGKPLLEIVQLLEK